MTQDIDPSPQPDGGVPERFRVDLDGRTLLGTYRVGSRLAEGGMGSIYRARDISLERPVVIKVPHARFLAEPGFRQRLAREISELVRLEHPHVVRILARGEEDDIPFFVLQYLGGGSLEDRLNDGVRQTPEDALPWLTVMARTLDFVHKRGSLHRDVKPGNILFDGEDHVFLSDFGVAKAVDAEGDALTGTGVGIGSPKYMAPEQALGYEVGPAVDQYGLASSLYEALAGDTPFHGTPVEILVRKSREDAKPIREFVPDLPEAAAAALMRAMARDPEERFPSCEAFADAFAAGLQLGTATAQAVPPPQSTRHTATETIRVPVQDPALNRKRLVGNVLATALVALALAAFFLRGGDEPSETPPSARARTGLAEVQLVDAGTPPRRRLRYDAAPGSRQGMALQITSSRSVDVDGVGELDMGEPSWGLEADVVVEKVDEEGDLHFTWQVSRCGLCKSDPDNAAIDAGLARIEGFSVRAQTTSRGIVHEVAFESNDELNLTVGHMLDRLRIAMSDFCTPLPEEPVGVGARWAVARTTTQFGMRMVETSEYTLLSSADDRLELRVKTALTAGEQDVSFPQAPAELAMTLTSLHGRGLGEIRLDLTRLVPLAFAARVEGNFEAESAAEGWTSQMTGTFLYDVELAPR